MGTCVDCPPSALVELIYIPDIWEMVCNLLDGDAISVLVRVPPFSAPTQGSPAFIFLAGINDNASIVPWNDVSNVLSSKYDRSHRLNWHREVAAEQTVECLLQFVIYPHYIQRHCRKLSHQAYAQPYLHSRGCPARPPSPDTTSIVDYDPYSNSLICSWPLNSPVFGVRSETSFAPFWNVLVGDSVSSDGNRNCTDSPAACCRSSSPILPLSSLFASRSSLPPSMIPGHANNCPCSPTGRYVVAKAALGKLSTLAIGLTIDGFGHISDNAGGIAFICYLGHCDCLQPSDTLTHLTGILVRERPDVNNVLQATALTPRIRPLLGLD